MTDTLKQEAERRMREKQYRWTGREVSDDHDHLDPADAVAVAVEMVQEASVLPQKVCEEYLEKGKQYGREAERERFRAKFQEMLDAYPEDIFIPPPPGKHGDTVDACSAAMGRHIAKMLLGFVDAIRNESKPPDNPGKTHFYGDGCDEEHGKRPCERCGGSGEVCSDLCGLDLSKHEPTPCPDCKPQEEK